MRAREFLNGVCIAIVMVFTVFVVMYGVMWGAYFALKFLPWPGAH